MAVSQLSTDKTQIKNQRSPSEVPTPDDLICSQVLPGFQFRISDLHKRPYPLAMTTDEVYRHFVLPDYQTQKTRAEQAELTVALKEKRIAYLTNKLKALGLSDEEIEG